MEFNVIIRAEEGREIWRMQVARPAAGSQPVLVVVLCGAPLRCSPQPKVIQTGQYEFELVLIANSSSFPIQLLTFSTSFRVDLQSCIGELDAKAVVAICLTDSTASVVVHDKSKPALSQEF